LRNRAALPNLEKKTRPADYTEKEEKETGDYRRLQKKKKKA